MKKALSLLLGTIILVGTIAFPQNAPALTKQQRKNLLEQRLKETEQKLNQLGTEQKDTSQYLNILDKKLVYLKEQYALEEAELNELGARIEGLEAKIEQNKSTISSISAQATELDSKYKALNKQFSSTYSAYCNRMRALYISGGGMSIISLILCSKDLSIFLARMDMVAIISKMDGSLMQSVKVQTNQILDTKQELLAKKQSLTQSQAELKQTTRELKQQKTALASQQKALGEKKNVILAQQQEANAILQSLNDQSQEYGELHDATKDELEEIDLAIKKADKKYTTTTKKNGAQKPIVKKEYFSPCYPCTTYTKVTCGFNDYDGHSGCDFSTKGDENQPIVAVDDGTVIISTDLKNSNGGYKSYGRYIVIRHTKTTKSGKAVYSLYAHNNQRLVKAGDTVKKGQQIAKSGSTGNSTGPHCHFELRIGGSSQKYARDPQKYLP